MIPVTDDIVTIIEDNVAKASPGSPPIAFGHGTEAYQNLQGDGAEIADETAWLMPFVLNDKLEINNTLTTQYDILMMFGKQSKLSASTDELKDFLREMYLVTKKFLVLLADDSRVMVVDNIRREPLYFSTDLTVTGYALRFRVQLEFEDFNYCVQSD